MAQQQSEKISLDASVRTSTGKGAARALRRDGFVPGVIYGEGISSFQIQIGSRELNRILHAKSGGNLLIALQLKKDSKQQENLVLIKELQHHPVTHQVVHVDFHQVSLTKRIIVTVPLSFKGEAVGVKKGDGVLEHLLWNLEVECLPTQIPAEILVDVSRLELDQAIQAKSIVLPEGVRLVTSAESTIAACVKPKVEEVAPVVEEGAAPAEPEVLKQKKPEELAAEEAQGKEKEKAKAPAAGGEEKKKEK